MAAIDAWGYTFAEAMERQQRGCFIFYRGMDLQEVAEEFADEMIASYAKGEVPELFTRYFDYDAFARDLRFDGYEETKYGVICDN
jgi:antirestriction protein